jgi:hypothetical protein
VCAGSPKEILDHFVSLPADFSGSAAVTATMTRACVLKMYHTGKMSMKFLKDYLWEQPPSKPNNADSTLKVSFFILSVGLSFLP